MDDPAPTQISYSVHGPAGAVRIVVDRWGIPHIRAASRTDAFFAQGFMAARERLFQIDLWRKRGLGLLAADYGPGFLAQDRAARLFLYRGDMEAEWAAYGTPQMRATVTAFVAGINAWIALTEADSALLAPEFAAMGIRPLRWDPADVVRIRSHALARNATSEMLRARVMSRASAETDLLRRSLNPLIDPVVPEGERPEDVPAEVLDVLRLATARFDLTPDRLAATLEQAARWTKVGEFGDVTALAEAEGSNNWAVMAARTLNRRPILASDPHRAVALPSLRWICHLTAPDLDVIGAGEPAVPGISIGHNGTIAFGLTIFPMDQEDIYYYETDPADPLLYRYGDGWERMRVEHETITLRDGGTQTAELHFTRHGPVVFEDAAKHRAYAIRAVWLEAGAGAYLGSLAYLDASSPIEFQRALAHWVAPSVNHVYADADDNIGWYVAGRAPIRPNWDGLLPVPGDGRFEWNGATPFSALPRAINPNRGFVWSANENNVPLDYPATDRKLGFEFSEPSRAARIRAMLDVQTRHSIKQATALQADIFSIPAQRVGALIRSLQPRGMEEARIGLGILREWDFELRADSAAALLFEIWWTRHLRPTMLARLVPQPELRALIAPGDTESLLGLLEDGDPAIPDMDALLLETLAAAVTECRRLAGDDPASWRWGRLHHGLFEHPLARVAGAANPMLRDVGPLPLGGSGSTPMNTSYRMADFRMMSGASTRIVVDVGSWDHSVCINAPGISGDPRSPHYDDHATMWAQGRTVPMLYTEDAIDSMAEAVITLQPK